MDQTRLHALEEQCIQECPPPCSTACPLHVDVRALAAAVAEGDFSTARKTFLKSVPFPEIIARICDQPCQATCNRREMGGAVAIAALERACLRLGDQSAARSLPIPKKGKSVAIVGGGLSGLTAAYDLAKKGYRVEIFETGPILGGRIRAYPAEFLPAQIIEADLASLALLGVTIHLHTRVGVDLAFDGLLARFDAIYLGIGSGQTQDIHFDLDTFDPLTRTSGIPHVFAGGSLVGTLSPVGATSDGRRAAISIDRFLQKVSLTASRANEGAYPSRLFTQTAGIEPDPAVRAADPEAGYDTEEASREAARCLQCECLECVKVCEYLSHYNGYPKKYVREIYNNLTMIGRVRSANQMINSCTLCGLCAEVCPERFDMGAVCRESRQAMVQTSKMPVSAHDFALRDFAFSASPAFELALPPADGEPCRYLFFPGCQLSGSSPEHVTRVYADLRDRLPGTGIQLGCCGAPAGWAGRQELFQAGLAGLKQTWIDLGNPEVILACSSCYRTFKTSLPEIPIRSLWEVYDQIGFPAAARPGLPKRLTIHDPCSTRDERNIQDSARRILGKLGVAVDELPLNRERTECCGYGGLVWLANPELAQDIVRRRVQEDPSDYVTYCAMCRDFFAAAGKPTYHLLDLIYAQPGGILAAGRGPGYSQRHENRARLKRSLQKAYAKNGESQMETSDEVLLLISPQVRELMEQRMILDEDLRAVIAYAERTHSKFTNPATGRCLASYRPAHVTYWVEYSNESGSFRVHNAYSHRMEIDRSAAA